MSTTAFDTAITQARDLLRWCSPLRTELWAAGLAAELEASEQAEAFLRRSEEDSGREARLALAALAAVGGPGPEDPHAVIESLPGWVRRMGRVTCDGGWYGKADPYGEQVLAALSFRYDNGKEPHVLVVGIDQPSGGLAVDAVVEEAKFLDELDLRPTPPESVAARILDAFELTDRVMGAQVADTLPAVRPFAIARARAALTRTHDTTPEPRASEPGEPGRARDTATEIVLPDEPGAQEAFGKLVEFVGDRPLWWSPARAAQFLTQWLPREAILSEAAIAAMPDVVRAWTRHQGGHPAVLRQIDQDAPRLPALMADDSLASLHKRLARDR
ncbi:hypothetical protein [Nonomuraea rubra]|uniref:Uncharacterized protein n=1 Tax=Nonomuraea rubra TaxID=46180 RepID=A0A7X0NNV6_9ACTN|nr:hypothetical protein [Nonomuraea rubra]MBB6546830.1 hypothetical protein [Nonomuraea rubra]